MVLLIAVGLSAEFSCCFAQFIVGTVVSVTSKLKLVCGYLTDVTV